MTITNILIGVLIVSVTILGISLLKHMKWTTLMRNDLESSKASKTELNTLEGTVSALSQAVNKKVDKNNLIEQINLSDENTKITGDKLHISESTTIDLDTGEYSYVKNQEDKIETGVVDGKGVARKTEITDEGIRLSGASEKHRKKSYYRKRALAIWKAINENGNEDAALDEIDLAIKHARDSDEEQKWKSIKEELNKILEGGKEADVIIYDEFPENEDKDDYKSKALQIYNSFRDIGINEPTNRVMQMIDDAVDNEEFKEAHEVMKALGQIEEKLEEQRELDQLRKFEEEQRAVGMKSTILRQDEANREYSEYKNPPEDKKHDYSTGELPKTSTLDLNSVEIKDIAAHKTTEYEPAEGKEYSEDMQGYSGGGSFTTELSKEESEEIHKNLKVEAWRNYGDQLRETVHQINKAKNKTHLEIDAALYSEKVKENNISKTNNKKRKKISRKK